MKQASVAVSQFQHKFKTLLRLLERRTQAIRPHMKSLQFDQLKNADFVV